MDKKLPKIFANKINKKLDNNASYYVGGNEPTKEERSAPINVNQKIKNIFSSPRYVYKADVVITLKDKIVTKKIIGKSGESLITMDNELIPISNILDIDFKK